MCKDMYRYFKPKQDSLVRAITKFWRLVLNTDASPLAFTYLIISIFVFMLSGMYLLAGAIKSGLYTRNAPTIEFINTIIPTFLELIKGAEVLLVFAIAFFLLCGWQLWQKRQIRQIIIAVIG